MTFLKNCWYMAGWSGELPADALLARKIADQPLVMFRDTAGRPHALLDRCPHRFAPLHMGCHLGDGVQCVYHGLRFDGSGACIHNPHGDHRIPPNARVRAFPLAELHGCLWVWPGEPALADRGAIPDFSCLNDELNHVGRGYLLAGANYVLETDNIMDLSHIDYLHPGTLGSSGPVTASTEVTREGNTVWSKRLTLGEHLPEFLQKTFGVPPGVPANRHLDVRWDPPSTLLIFASVTLPSRPDVKVRGRRIANIFSPESETSTHYWYAISYDKADLGADGPEIAQRSTDALRKPFVTEDLPVIEAVQRSMGGDDFWSLHPVMLAGDGGPIRARRVLNNLIQAEAGRAVSQAATEGTD